MASTTLVTTGPATSETMPETFREATRSEGALQRVEDQVLRIWETLQPTTTDARVTFAEAIRRAAPIVPCLVAPRPHSAEALNRDLRIALVNYHPEEIRVVGYTLLSSVLEIVYETCGERLGKTVEHILDSVPPTTH